MALLKWLAMPALLVFLFAANLTIGTVAIPLPDILSIIASGEHQNSVWSNIVWDFRLPKALTCILAGSALSVSGLQMQTLFRNALAGPDVLGITSGASLAVSLVVMGNPAGISHPWSITAAASIGCLAVFLIMLIVSRNLRDNVSLLIIGLMVGAGTSSIVSVLQYLSAADDLQMYMIWTFGSLAALNWAEIKILALVLMAGSALAFSLSKSLNIWFLGENYARSVGVQVDRSRLGIILSACLLTGAVTAFCGPLAFVGLAVPHLTKVLLQTHNHKVLIPNVMVAGGALLLFCDILTKVPGTSQVLPINAVTALIGAPVVIWVILKRRVIN